MSSIWFPFAPRPEDPEGHMPVMDNLRAFADIFDKGVDDGDVLTWDQETNRWTAAPGVAVPIFGTAFPPDPSPNQEAIMVDNPANPTYAWRFIFIPTIADAYQWVQIGGGYFQNFIATEEYHTLPAVWENLATDGPKFTAPWAGYYEVIAHANGLNSNAATQGGQLGIALNDTTPVVANQGNFMTQARTSHIVSGTVLAAAGDVIKLRYYTYATTDIGWGFRDFFVRPFRVSI